MDYTKICFVIMPFGKKKVGELEVDFDNIYDSIFGPAISVAELPEGGKLIPKRTDRDFFSGEITVEMFQYLEYSRFALTDISGLNANVFYELGVRHRARQSGTAIFRQVNTPLPFDISHIKAFPYEYEPEESAVKARLLIAQVLKDSLMENRLDSPVQLGLKAQQADPGELDHLLREAQNAIRVFDKATAIQKYRQAVQIGSDNAKLRVELGLLLKDAGKWEAALEQFSTAASLSPTYAEAQREKGIAEDKLHYATGADPNSPTGESSLLKAIALNPHDFDAMASLGGALKRQKRYEEALAMYRQATKASDGNPYPLLNELKLAAQLGKGVALDAQRKFYIDRAERALHAQTTDNPPYNVPWSFFDLSEIRLLKRDRDGFLDILDKGISYCEGKWQAKTHRESLQLYRSGGINLPGLEEGITKLEEAEGFLPD
jgi:tetratricopeptide (TPR) repeat protein